MHLFDQVILCARSSVCGFVPTRRAEIILLLLLPWKTQYPHLGQGMQEIHGAVQVYHRLSGLITTSTSFKGRLYP